MLPIEHVVELSRWQFGITALYHFIFVPLTLGMTWILFGMECLYVKTGKQVYKDMVRFWGKLFGINFAMGVVTGITMEFEFGVNWAYYSQYVGDIFGAPLAIEGLVAFMLESTFFGIFFFGWDKLSKKQHLFATFCLAIGSMFSALFILIANGWMQHPVGSQFNIDSMRMELTSFYDVLLNPTAQAEFAHTITAGLVTAAMFVTGISSYYLLKGRDIVFAKRSFIYGSFFGLIVLLGVAFFGDHAGLDVDETQPMKMAAIEGLWETPEAPAPWTILALPSNNQLKNLAAIKIPYALSIIATHSLDGTVKGMQEIIADNVVRMTQGRKAYLALIELRTEKNIDGKTLSAEQLATAKHTLERYKDDLGYGLLLKSYISDIQHASEAQIQHVAKQAIPEVWAVFYSFRLMIGCFGIMLLIVLAAGFFNLRGKLWEQRWLFRTALYAIPLPFLACLFGWFVAEHGRQPWVVQNTLPTAMGASSVSTGQLTFSLTGFALFYTLLFIIEIYLMFKYARLGPSALHSGRYHFEQLAHANKS
ncbi:Cytochrome d ubiquinol oxidase subunit 1 [Piscirickettsia salmonis]|uniref:Cytochrome d ubiquinol oxidase subunit 1 n=1 Tax=Piscirickettsia salmonis TaxID=1238 RepID=A0A1L6TBE3_PISSA|nr:cytochrome ubiquinol oxidase subunit I [Piscirickettsia salmonis]AKP73702.1 cytochrome d terminal oxidase subunit 1 [Piscirickettsia salmonis LF-89 = ATCC VR-1361]ALB22489.1 cytochrome d ubiquinol oxidase subunit 1 [Piscirickettsia salmonis]ALY02527.1 cytochrome d terminal oxidase subunit 1 [Piscirickettsia salmonis]AMA42068.1 cytochrome d terminal oxidase subunit 1 [Piscirickettsia salmonis]AOS34539.1 cytochrome d terminal oxidase subunit 1 [Piscirickettsia salmonis]